ncbi:MAG: sporulation protein [Lachnospiraceae bacterium]|nr:sporulation protein [Lachnospiraceae bacterium]MBQ6319833.1 GerW family sporulation protein [Lachnospiraceae bacterium]MBR1451615.1 GerW family sporulation protein [Lachnospiraceae bacterium]
MAESSFNSVVNSLLSGMEGFLSSKTVVGEPVVVKDTIIIPFVDVSFGVGAGTFRGDKKDNGAGGLTGKMTPTAVLVIQNNSTRVVSIKNQDSITKIIDMVPEIMNKITSKKESQLSDEEVLEAAKDAGNEE